MEYQDSAGAYAPAQSVRESGLDSETCVEW